jgi:hypothetical protein
VLCCVGTRFSHDLHDFPLQQRLRILERLDAQRRGDAKTVTVQQLRDEEKERQERKRQQSETNQVPHTTPRRADRQTDLG